MNNTTVFKNTDREFTGTLEEIANHFRINYMDFVYFTYYKGRNLEEMIDLMLNYDEEKAKKNYIYNKIYTVFKDSDVEFTGDLYALSYHFYHRWQNVLKDLYFGISLEEQFNGCYIVFKETNIEFVGDKTRIAQHFFEGNNYKKDKRKFYKKLREYSNINKKDIDNGKDIGFIVAEIVNGYKTETQNDIEDAIKKIDEKFETKRKKEELNYRKLHIREMNNGQKATILNEYGHRDKSYHYFVTDTVDVQFEDGTIRENINYNWFKNGDVSNPNYIISGISYNEIICAYYLNKIGFYKKRNGTLKDIDPDFGKMEFDLYGEIDNPEKGQKYRIAIEYDGFHHSYDEDYRKNKLCVKNNILLIRIREPQLEKYQFGGIKQFYLDNNYVGSNNLQETLYKIVEYINQTFNTNYKIDIDFYRDLRSINEIYNSNRKSKKYNNKILIIKSNNNQSDQCVDWL